MLSDAIVTEGLQSAYDSYMEKIFLVYIESLASGDVSATDNFKKGLDLGTQAMETAQQQLGLKV
jgi:hypothetical protein